MNYLKRIFQSSESGVTLILVLMLVAAVGLLVIPVMLITSTGLKATNASEQRFMERYAVDAGVEHALWRIKHKEGATDVKFADPGYAPGTFNELQPFVIITPRTNPANVTTVPLQAPVGSKGLTGYKTVSKNWVSPCVSGPLLPPCPPETFEYKLYIENYGEDVTKINIEEFGDCLPPDFVVKDVIDVGGFDNSNWDDPIKAYDMKPHIDFWWGGLSAYGPVGGVDDDNPKKHPQVFFSVVEGDTDPAHPCGPVGGVNRQQVKWVFKSPKPEVPKRIPAGCDNTISFPCSFDGRAWIVLEVTTNGLAEGVYYNEMWYEASPGDLVDGFTCGTSPVYARFPTWDITSSAGGTTVKVRASVRENILPEKPIIIQSWQVADGPPGGGGPPFGSIHVGSLCGRAVELSASNWEAEVPVMVHNSGDGPVPNATVSGTWSVPGSGSTTSCITDSSGKCMVFSGKLSKAPGASTKFTVINIDDGTSNYAATYDHPNPSSFAVICSIVLCP